MTIPVVAICGRPNVGKSTLFNAISGRRISIVEPTSGVTRDRVETLLKVKDYYYELIDTGGIGVVDEHSLEDKIYDQINIGIQKADLLFFVVDIKEGITPLDKEVARLLHKQSKNAVLIANKTDEAKFKMEAPKFIQLGFGEPLCISAQQRHGIDEIMAIIEEKVAPFNCVDIEKEEKELKIAVVGQPNAGKSTFINALANEERVIVSEIPGTTRDSIDVRFEKDGKSILAIDTAGLKRRKNVRNSIEFYSQARAQRAIRRSDVVLLFIDATKDISRIDREIAMYVREQHKPTIIVINKWDLVPEHLTTSDYEDYISKTLPHIFYAPVSFITAKTSKNVTATIHLARSLIKQAHRRISTGELNRVLKTIIMKKSPRVIRGQKVKIFYGTQADVNPPTMVLFCNKPQLVSKNYKRYMFNSLQEKLRLAEIPIRVEFRDKKSQPGQKDLAINENEEQIDFNNKK